MAITLSLVFLMISVTLIALLALKRDIIFAQFGILGVFAIAYYTIPVLFKSSSALADEPDDWITASVGLHLVFFVSMLLGAFVASAWAKALNPLHVRPLDDILVRRRAFISTVAVIVILINMWLFPASTYSAENLRDYIEAQDPYRQASAGFSALGIAFVAFSFSDALKRRQARAAMAYGGIIGLAVLVAFSTGARQLIISPLVLVYVNLCLDGRKRLALSAAGLVAVILVLASPLVVYMRENHGDEGSRIRVVEAYKGFGYGENPLETLVQGVVERADLLDVTIKLKDIIDSTNYVGWPFYYSVLVAPIPRIIYPNKPYVLSDNGQIDGEISIMAWKATLGGDGSLSAFGGIVAYREGGWLAVVLDGLAAGVLYRVVARWLGGGGVVGRLLFSNFLLAVAVGKVPASFFEALAALLGQAPLLLMIVMLSKALKALTAKPMRRRRTASLAQEGGGYRSPDGLGRGA